MKEEKFAKQEGKIHFLCITIAESLFYQRIFGVLIIEKRALRFITFDDSSSNFCTFIIRKF